MATPSTLWFNSSHTVSTKSAVYGDTIQVYIKRSLSTYRHKIFAEIRDGVAWSLVLGDWDETTGEGASTAVKASYESDITDWGTIHAKLDSGVTLSPNSVITFYLYTYTSSKQLIGYTTRVVNMSLPANMPSIPYRAIEPSSGNQYIQGYSKIKVAADLYAGSANESIASLVYVTPGGTKIVDNPPVVNKGNGFYQLIQYETDSSISKYSGNDQAFRFYIINSNNQSSDFFQTRYNVVPYILPKITAYGMSRYSYADGNWTQDDSGEYLKYYFTASVNELESNTGTYKIQYKKTTAPADTWQGTVVLATGASSYNITQIAPAPLADPISSENYVTLSADYAWTIRFSVTDSLGGYTSYQELTLAVGLTTLDFLAGGKGVAIGKVAEKVTSPTALGYSGLFDVGFDTRLRKNVQIDGDLTSNGDTTISNLHVTGDIDFDTPLSVGNGGTGSTKEAFEDDQLVIYNEALGGYLGSVPYDYVQDWLQLGDLAYEDYVNASDVWGLGDLATLDSISLLGNYVSGTLPIDRGGTGAISASAARSNLGLGSLATKSKVDLSSEVSNSLPISNGGTGGTSDYWARYNLGFYSNTVNIHVSSTYHAVDLGPLPGGASDNYVIVATPNQDTGSQCDLYWYIKRSNSSGVFRLHVIDKAGYLDEYVTFGWMAMKIT